MPSTVSFLHFVSYFGTLLLTVCKAQLCPTGITASTTIYNTSLVNVGDGISIGFYVNCSSSQIIFKLQGPSNKWFGIVFSEAMFGDSIIYTTGEANNKPLGLHDYYLFGGNGLYSTVAYDSQQDLTLIQQSSIDSDTIYLEYSRLLDTDDSNDMVFNSETITFRYAFAETQDLQLSYHGPHSKSEQILKIDLKTGDISKEIDIKAILEMIHAILMWIVWSFLFPFNIFITRNKQLIWNDAKRWFMLHILLAVIIVILNIMSIVIIMYVVENSRASNHGGIDHHILGFFIIISLILHVILGIFRPHKAEKHELESIQRRIWKIIHGLNAMLLLVISNWNIILGINLKGETSLVIVHVIWISVIGFVLLLFEWKRSHSRLYSVAHYVDNDIDEIELSEIERNEQTLVPETAKL